MVARQLVFYRWSSMDAKPPFVPHEAFDELGSKIGGDPAFAVIENDDVTTAVRVVAVGSVTNPARIQLLALRNSDNWPSQWQPGGQIGPLPLQTASTRLTRLTS